MNCKFFGQMMILWSISLGVLAQSPLSSKLPISDITATTCSADLKEIERDLDDLTPADYIKELQGTKENVILERLWSSKIELHEKIRRFHSEDGLNLDCSKAARGALRAIRTAEDILNESEYRKNKDSVVYPEDSFGLDNAHVKRHPDFESINLMKDLKSGDVILSRGNAYTSSAIANLGEFDTQFSHLSVVYKDENGKFWTIEAHIEVGVFVRPLEDHIDDKNFRSMIYRFDDEEIAAKAAEHIFKKVKKASETTGNIFYDFGFNLEDSTTLFCSEVASYAYNYSSNGNVSVPLHKSRLMIRKPEFVKMLGISVEESFVPADLEVDPRFKIISEWKNAAKINDSLEKDAILQAMFKWHDDEGYRLVQGSSKKSFIYRNVAWPLRRIPYLKRYVINKLPLNMSRKLIGYFGVLESVGEYLQKDLSEANKDAIAIRGIGLSKKEKYEVLEATRLKDLNAKKKILHRMFKKV